MPDDDDDDATVRKSLLKLYSYVHRTLAFRNTPEILHIGKKKTNHLVAEKEHLVQMLICSKGVEEEEERIPRKPPNFPTINTGFCSSGTRENSSSEPKFERYFLWKNDARAWYACTVPASGPREFLDRFVSMLDGRKRIHRCSSHTQLKKNQTTDLPNALAASFLGPRDEISSRRTFRVLYRLLFIWLLDARAARQPRASRRKVRRELLPAEAP